jgi:hypothetical protein
MVTYDRFTQIPGSAAGIIPVKDSHNHNRIKPLALASGHGRYITVTPVIYIFITASLLKRLGIAGRTGQGRAGINACFAVPFTDVYTRALFQRSGMIHRALQHTRACKNGLTYSKNKQSDWAIQYTVQHSST